MSANLLDGLRRLKADTELYTDLLTAGEDIRVEVLLTDLGKAATVVLGEEIGVLEGSINPDLRLTMEGHVFQDILDNEADFGALIGRSKMSDVRPVNFEFLKSERVSEVNDTLKAMMVFFFTPGRVKVKRLKSELAGEAHGGHPIPLAYWDGMRSAWYTVKKGETLNEEGERDDYTQAVVILKGKGKFIIEDTELAVEPSTIIYVPKNSLHQLKAEEDVEAIWLAWQTPP
jgi:mannose-6-phosphate isomerase-like protein (cupin superfamily)